VNGYRWKEKILLILKSSDLLLFLAAHSSREEKKIEGFGNFFSTNIFDASNHFTSQAINLGRLLFCAGAN
jgi:hypothetical protein